MDHIHMNHNPHQIHLHSTWVLEVHPTRICGAEQQTAMVPSDNVETTPDHLIECYYTSMDRTKDISN